MQSHIITPQGYSQQFVITIPYTPWFDLKHVAFNPKTNSLKYYARSAQEASALASVLPPNCPLASVVESHTHYYHSDEIFDPMSRECCAAAQHVASSHNGIKYNPQQHQCCRQIQQKFNRPKVIVVRQPQASLPYGYPGLSGSQNPMNGYNPLGGYNPFF